MPLCSVHSVRHVLQTIGTGLVVLVYEVYWFFGPGWSLRSAVEGKEKRIEAVRERLAGSDNPTILTELKELEASLEATRLRQNAEREAHLSRMQYRVSAFGLQR